MLKRQKREDVLSRIFNSVLRISYTVSAELYIPEKIMVFKARIIKSGKRHYISLRKDVEVILQQYHGREVMVIVLLPPMKKKEKEVRHHDVD